jgi:hypothetical protein
MIDEKFCPYAMANGHGGSVCKYEKCMAWVPECPSDVICNDGESAMYCKRVFCEGYCKLIDGARK